MALQAMRKYDGRQAAVHTIDPNRHLNAVLSDLQPTAENLAHFLFDWCAEQGWPVGGVGVSETPKTWAWYER